MRLKPLYHAALGCLYMFASGCGGGPAPVAPIADYDLPEAHQEVRVYHVLSLTDRAADSRKRTVSEVTISWLEGGPKSWSREGYAKGWIGRNGFAPPDAKVEGDGKTPSGIYPVGLTFGYSATLNTRMPYHPLTEKDFWIDDPKSPDYNRLVSGAKPEVSHEVMRRQDEAYSLGAVIEYNTTPVVPGKGSAIFIHLANPGSHSTAGCVAFEDKKALERFLCWLDPAKNPRILLNVPDSTKDFCYDNAEANPKIDGEKMKAQLKQMEETAGRGK